MGRSVSRGPAIPRNQDIRHNRDSGRQIDYLERASRH